MQPHFPTGLFELWLSLSLFHKNHNFLVFSSWDLRYLKFNTVEWEYLQTGWKHTCVGPNASSAREKTETLQLLSLEAQEKLSQPPAKILSYPSKRRHRCLETGWCQSRSYLAYRWTAWSAQQAAAQSLQISLGSREDCMLLLELELPENQIALNLYLTIFQVRTKMWIAVEASIKYKSRASMASLVIRYLISSLVGHWANLLGVWLFVAISADWQHCCGCSPWWHNRGSLKYSKYYSTVFLWKLFSYLGGRRQFSLSKANSKNVSKLVTRWYNCRAKNVQVRI